ncbi:hypothetical protein [Roseburia sp. MSJ-14]|mgnify:FL=1|uniref:hypothetical protein n=1 Tax=Roseburia sp. MSJ-14 TaxID=2841514 RepID=UPI001C11372B|nr:hypothetical protein [Roseburia sp. MSJ-14]MBU5474794.1 hypothetical protein [Roseburia sp. MSJ-14]
MENREAFKKTEQFAIEEEARENRWQQEYGKKLPEVMAQIDQLLKEGTEEAKWKLHAMFLDKDFFDKYKQTDEMANMYVIMQIFERERNSGITPGILDSGRDAEQLRNYIQSIKFLLYRLDFEIDEQAGEKLIAYFQEQNTSTIVIETMLTTVVMRPFIVVRKLEQLFEQHHMLKELFMIYNFINDKYPGNKRILKKQAELYARTGHQELAQQCMEQIGDYPEGICGSRETVLSIQEKIWRLRYMEKEACTEIAREIKTVKLSPEGWKCFLENEPVFAPEYYLLLTNAMLNEELTEIAEITLLFANEKVSGNEMILSLLADMYINQGAFKEALEVLEQIQQPSDIILKLQQVCRERIV